MLLALLGYRHWRYSPMDGTWLRESSSGRIFMPDAATRVPVMSNEVSVRLTRDQFTMRYWAFDGVPGVEHFTVQLDDREHPYLSVPGSPVKITYRAQMEGDAVVVAKHVFSPSEDFGSYSERWSITPGGHKLTVSTPEGETIYKRAPFLSSLFRPSP